MFSRSSLGHFFFDTIFENGESGELSQNRFPYKSELLHRIQTAEPHCNLVDSNTLSLDVAAPNTPNLDVQNNFTNLFFHGTYSHEGAGVGCIIVDPEGTKTVLSHRIEYEFSCSIAAYEALIQGLKMATDLNIKYSKVYGDTNDIIK